jgi:hypothetical protein
MRIVREKLSFEEAISKPKRTKKFLWNEEYYSLKELAKISDIPYRNLLDRVSGKKWSLERAMNTPVKTNKKES